MIFVIEIAASLFSLLSVFLITLNKRISWVVAIFGILPFMYLFYIKGEYSNFYLQIVYIIQSIIGWYKWGDKELLISRMNKKDILLSKISLPVLFALTYILSYLSNSTYVFLDSLTTTLSLYGTYLLSIRKLESWIFWIFVNILFVYLFIFNNMIIASFSYFIFFINSIYGLYKWKSVLNKS